MAQNITLGIMGPSRAGKDDAADWLVKNTTLTYGGSTSIAISREVARREGLTFEAAHEQRHRRKVYWRSLGDQMREGNPAALAREMLEGHTLLVGVRARIEMQAVRSLGLCDLVIWVDRPGIPHDPTLEFGPELCDLTVHNWWTLEEYFQRWYTLSKSLGIMRT